MRRFFMVEHCQKVGWESALCVGLRVNMLFWRPWCAMRALQETLALLRLFILISWPASTHGSFSGGYTVEPKQQSHFNILSLCRCSHITFSPTLYHFHEPVSNMAPTDWVNRGKRFSLLLGNKWLCYLSEQATRHVFQLFFEEDLQ